MSEVDATKPLDEPHTRTRLAWGRTMLALLIVVLLLVRSAYVTQADWAMFLILMVTVGLVLVWVRRGRELRHASPIPLRTVELVTFTFGTAVLSVLGIVLVALSH